MNLNVIVYGASGMVGEGVLHECLLHPDVASVLVVGRRSCGVRHPKLTEVLHADLTAVHEFEQELTGRNAAFFCLGTTSIGKSEELYTRITYDLTMAHAKALARLNPGMSFCYVSGLGTDSTERGRTMWARVKGKTENDILKLPFRSAFMFRPGFIRPTPGLKFAYGVSRVLGVAYPLLAWLMPGAVCTLEDLGRAMIRAVSEGYERPILENRDIAKLGAPRDSANQ